MKRLSFFGLAVVVLLGNAVLFTNCSRTQKSQVPGVFFARVDSVLQLAATYQYGQSREALTTLADYVRAGNKSAKFRREFETRFIQFLESRATLAGKLFVCKQLSIIGSDASVPILAKMLVQEQTSDMARYVLERIGSKKAAEALRSALPDARGAVEVGIINSLGQMQDKDSVPLLTERIGDSDGVVAQAAITALGKIANQQAITVLEEALANPPAGRLGALFQAYLMCADRLFVNRQKSRATEMYRRVWQESKSIPIRSAALSGLLKTSMNDPVPLVLMVLQKEPPALQAAAIAAIRDFPEGTDLQPIVDQFTGLSSSAQVQILTALADFGDSRYREIAIRYLQNPDPRVRIAALKALAVLGDHTHVALLVHSAVADSGGVQEVARKSLTRLRGKQVNATIIQAMATADPASKVELLHSLAGRYVTEAVELVLKTTRDNDQKVRVESFKTLGVIAGPEILPAVVSALLKTSSQEERREAKLAVTAVALKIANAKNRADAILTVLPDVQNVASRSSLIEILGKLGDPDALPVLRESLQSQQTTIRLAAIRALSDWPDDTPLNDLLQVAQTAGELREQILALRGYIGLVDLGRNREADESVKLYQTAMGLAKQPEEQKMVLSGLGKIAALSALNMASSYLDNPQLKEEAELAVVQIARNIYKDYPQKTKNYLIRILAQSKNENALNQANRILEKIKNAAQ